MKSLKRMLYKVPPVVFSCTSCSHNIESSSILGHNLGCKITQNTGLVCLSCNRNYGRITYKTHKKCKVFRKAEQEVVETTQEQTKYQKNQTTLLQMLEAHLEGEHPIEPSVKKILNQLVTRKVIPKSEKHLKNLLKVNLGVRNADLWRKVNHQIRMLKFQKLTIDAQKRQKERRKRQIKAKKLENANLPSNATAKLEETSAESSVKGYNPLNRSSKGNLSSNLTAKNNSKRNIRNRQRRKVRVASKLNAKQEEVAAKTSAKGNNINKRDNNANLTAKKGETAAKTSTKGYITNKRNKNINFPLKLTAKEGKSAAKTIAKRNIREKVKVQTKTDVKTKTKMNQRNKKQRKIIENVKTSKETGNKQRGKLTSNVKKGKKENTGKKKQKNGFGKQIEKKMANANLFSKLTRK